MSSFNKGILTNSVRISEKPVHVSDRAINNESDFKEAYMKHYLEESKRRIEEKEREIKKEIELKRDQVFQEAYEEAKEKAILEAEHTVREKLENEYSEKISAANSMYSDAENHLKTVIENEESMRERFKIENEEHYVKFAFALSEKILNQCIDRNLIDVEKVFESAVSQIKHETKQIFVRVNPNVHMKLNLNEKIKLDSRISLISDLNVKDYDFVIETDREFLDVTIDTQIKTALDIARSVIDDNREG